MNLSAMAYEKKYHLQKTNDPNMDGMWFGANNKECLQFKKVLFIKSFAHEKKTKYARKKGVEYLHALQTLNSFKFEHAIFCTFLQLFIQNIML